MAGNGVRDAPAPSTVGRNVPAVRCCRDYRFYVMETGRVVATIPPGQVTVEEVRRHLML